MNADREAGGLNDHIFAADPRFAAFKRRAVNRCKHLGCHLAGIKLCECLGAKVVRPPVYVVGATPTHPEKPWAVGREIRPGCLKVVAYVESKWLADMLAKRLGGGLIHGSQIDMKPKPRLMDPGDGNQDTALR